MGTTRIKVIDLSSDQQEVKTSRKRARLASLAKRAEKLAGSPRKLGEAGTAKIKEDKRISDSVDQSAGESVNQLVSEPVDQKSESPTHRITDTLTHRHTESQTQHRGKKYQEVSKLIDKSLSYPLSEAINLLYKTSTTTFDPTVEVHINVSDKNLKGTVAFPHAVGGKIKEKKYLIFGEKQSAVSGQQIIWANEQTIKDIEEGKLKPKRDFAVVIASPKFMPALAKIAKILGPVGIMPNPKNGTITEDVTSFLKKGQSAGNEYKTDPTAPIIHTKIGKLSAKPQELSDNLKALIAQIGPGKIQKTIIKSTMSPGIKLDINTISK